MTYKKASSVFLAAVVAGTLVLGAVAWACTGAQAQVSIVPRSAAVGEPVKVLSEGFSPISPVEIRWNSATGPVVGSEVGPDNAVAVNIPSDAKPGLYYLVVMQPRDGSKVAADSFEVLKTGPGNGITGRTPQQTERISADLWSGFSSNSALETSGATSPVENRSTGTMVGLGLGLVAIAGAALLFALVFAGLSARERSGRSPASSNKRTG